MLNVRSGQYHSVEWLKEDNDMAKVKETAAQAVGVRRQRSHGQNGKAKRWPAK